MEFRFAHIEYLYALAALPVLALLMMWGAAGSRRLLERMAEPSLLTRLTPSKSGMLAAMRISLLLVAITALIVALSRPQFGQEERRETSEGIDIYLLVDLSRSMLSAPDDSPGIGRGPNRLDLAKQILDNLILQLGGDRVGIIPFTAEAYVFCPLTLDHRVARDFLGEISLDLIGTQGTDIGNAIDYTVEQFENIESPADRAILLITDGEDHGGDAQAAALRAKDKGVAIFALGLGGQIGAPIPLGQGRYVQDDTGVVESRIDMESLESIAQITGGSAYRVQQSGLLETQAIFRDLATLKKGERAERVFAIAVEQFPWFLGIALASILLASVPLPQRRKRKWEGRFV